MKRILFLSVMLLALGGCRFDSFHKTEGSGTMKLEKRAVPAFTAVDISGAYDVEIVAQKEQGMEIESDENLLPLIKTEVKNGVLTIYNEKGFSTKHTPRLRISLANLDGISSSGASDITVTGVKSEEFKIETSGAGRLNISGETKTLAVSMSGAGDVDAKDLHAQKVSVNSSGAADASVYASEELSVEASGAGNVSYYGDPKNVVKESSGATTITKK